ncbi:MAG: peptide deformylase [Rickettsiales bacterium]|nr:peptide deformylase [Rickettsiales bacterium]
MTVLPIVIAPDARLKTRSKTVDAITPDILQLMDDMLDTMYAANGIGLSAVQVGVLKRIIVVDVEQRDEEGVRRPIKMINPEIIGETEDLNLYSEGCLSFPGQFSDVERPESVRVRYFDEHFKEHVMEADGLLATCVQHEIDHMNGIVFVDHLTRVKRDVILRKVKKAIKMQELPAYPVDLS